MKIQTSPTICQHLYTLGVEVKFTRNGEDCGGLSDCEELSGGYLECLCLCEELSGGYSQEMMGLVLGYITLTKIQFCDFYFP